MDIVMLVLAALATHRVSFMVSQEEGPFGIFTTLRGRFDPDQRTWVGRGLNCIKCVSFWVGLLVAALLPQSGSISYILTALALSSAAIGYQKWTERR